MEVFGKSFSGTTKILGLDPYSFLRDLFKSWETQPRTLAWKELPQFKSLCFISRLLFNRRN
ncbi:hypothetical protein LeptoLang_21250 (plasmid) [Leptospira interrogans serovar Icterohaemorrhagiae]|nr:hypothetical protein LeptoLang_21250 [Leptospira interrogans serovar Icterohaemorrhagiae]